MSNLYLIMCKTKIRNIDIDTENEKEKYGISCFLVPIETKGLSFGVNEKYVRAHHQNGSIFSFQISCFCDFLKCFLLFSPIQS